jgi:protoporphyrinogen oxidase
LPAGDGGGMRDTVILGAGLAGMSTAYHLKSGYEIIERESAPGGLVVTHERDGFHFDVTGHWLHMRDAGIRGMVDALMAGQMQTVQRDSRIFSKNVYTFYPFQTNTYGLPIAVIKEIIAGFVETLTHPVKAEPKSFEDWVLKHMGAGIARHFMIPYNEKLWCTHPRDMTPHWCQHYVPKPDLDQILEGALRAPDDVIGYNATFSYPQKGGIGALTSALAKTLKPGSLHTGVSPVSIDAKKKRIELSDGRSLGYRHLVSSIPLPKLVELIGDAPSSVKTAAARLVCNEVFYYNVAVDGEIGTPAHWVYLPEEPFVMYRAGSYSNAVPSMAPKGSHSLYVEISHRGAVSDTKALRDKVLRNLIDARIIRAKKQVRFIEGRNIPYAYVVFDHHYARSTRLIHEWLGRQNIRSIGRYGRWTYNSMETALIDGREAATSIRAEKKDLQATG